ncbi:MULTISPECIES: hypothetical protein [unclassified Cryobacterium]|uniref:hypothetical protein n=1 Tax=unclassified Cryobacterium TaxID=2649013 RepID=UPI00141BB846|nr:MULTISPECIES: hypothetical protein [unclassified Cryobacterium]
MLFLKWLVGTGELHPLFDRSYSHAQIREAYLYVTAGQKIGNVVIHVQDEI